LICSLPQLKPSQQAPAQATGSFAGKQQAALPKYQPVHQPSMPTIQESDSDVGSGVMSITDQDSADEPQGANTPEALAVASDLLAQSLPHWSQGNLQQLKQQVATQLPNTVLSWAEEVEEAERQETLNLIQTDGASNDSSTDEEGEVETVEESDSSESEPEEIDYTSFWEIHPEDPKEIKELKNRYISQCNAALSKCQNDDEKVKVCQKHQANFELEMADKVLREENHIPRYERFWNYSAKVAASGQKGCLKQTKLALE
jgi:hypothetical protein